MLKANVSFCLKDDKLLPFNNDFDDFYTSVSNALEQKLEAFINPAFEDIRTKQDRQFVFLELGFGLGLNFFLFANECLKHKDKKFYYIGYEKYYHDIEILKKSWEIFGLKSLMMDTFINLYPMQRHGIYRIRYENITLDLVYGKECLDDYDFLCDYVFVDGFKSSTNTSFYEEEFLKQISGFLRKDSVLFSYASNSLFKKSLASSGFDVIMQKSLYKRENIKAIYKNDVLDKEVDGYLLKNLSKDNAKKVVSIIGSGVASAVLAYLLKDYEDDVNVFEKDEINSGASTNEIGLLSALILKNSSHMKRYCEDMYLNATRFYKNEFDIVLEGCYEHAFDDEKIKRFNDQKDNILYEIKENEAFIKNGGALEPIKLVKQVFEKSNAKIHTHYNLKYYKKIGDKIELCFENGKTFLTDILIFCTGSGSKELLKNDFKLSINQGQVTLVKEFLNTLGYSTKSYITKAKNGIQIIGATYDRIEHDDTFLSKEQINKNNSSNINDFISFYPHKINANDIKIIGHNIGNRCYSSDRFAILGGFFDKDWCKLEYKDLFFTKHKAQKRLPKTNVYLSIAHGSRGLGSAIMGANIIISSIYGVPSGYLKSIEKQTHPTRFIFRKLKKS